MILPSAAKKTKPLFFWLRGSAAICPGNSDVNLLRCSKGIIDLDARTVLNFVVAEQELHTDYRCAGKSRLPLSVVSNGYRKAVGLGR